MNVVSFDEAARVIEQGELAVIPTDTLYGIVAGAFDAEAVERIFDLKNRDRSKRCIVLAASINQLESFGIPEKSLEQAKKYWPASVSIELPVSGDFKHLLRGHKVMSFRVPDDDDLQAFLAKSGPVIAPSANKESERPAETIEQAYDYFGDAVDAYVDGGKRVGEPSTLIGIDEEGNVTIYRQGRVQIT